MSYNDREKWHESDNKGEGTLPLRTYYNIYYHVN